MRGKRGQEEDIRMLDALLDDIERALADEGTLSEEDKAKFHELRQQCRLKKESLLKLENENLSS